SQISKMGLPVELRPEWCQEPSSIFPSNESDAPTRSLSREKNSMFSVYFPFSKVYEPPPVPEHSPVLMLMATHWNRVPLNIFRVLRSRSGIWPMSSPCFLPVMRHTPAIGPSLASIRFHEVLLPERSVVN